mgnify:CR=1 FL=1
MPRIDAFAGRGMKISRVERMKSKEGYEEQKTHKEICWSLGFSRRFGKIGGLLGFAVSELIVGESVILSAFDLQRRRWLPIFAAIRDQTTRDEAVTRVLQ